MGDKLEEAVVKAEDKVLVSLINRGLRNGKSVELSFGKYPRRASTFCDSLNKDYGNKYSAEVTVGLTLEESSKKFRHKYFLVVRRRS